MKGLFYKDWSVLVGQYRKNILLLLVVYLGMAYLFDTPFMLYALVFMFGIYTQSALSFDEKCHWDTYAHTLPVSPAPSWAANICWACLPYSADWESGLPRFCSFPALPGAPWAWRKRWWECW